MHVSGSKRKRGREWERKGGEEERKGEGRWEERFFWDVRMKTCFLKWDSMKTIDKLIKIKIKNPDT